MHAFPFGFDLFNVRIGDIIFCFRLTHDGKQPIPLYLQIQSRNHRQSVLGVQQVSRQVFDVIDIRISMQPLVGFFIILFVTGYLACSVILIKYNVWEITVRGVIASSLRVECDNRF